MTPETLIVRTLARQYAAFAPVRVFDGPWGPNAYEARQAANATGLPAPIGGGDGADRMTAARTIADAVQSDLVRATHAGGRPLVKLTTKGEVLAMALAGMPTYRHCIAKVRQVHKLCHGWVNELAITDRRVKYGHDLDADGQFELRWLAWTLAPAMMRGWVESGSSVRGHAAYRITSSPKDWIAPAKELSLDPTDEASDAFMSEYASAIASLQTKPPAAPGELGIIPLPMDQATRYHDRRRVGVKA